MEQTTDSNGESNGNHPAGDLETVVVDPDDVIEMLRRNDRDQDEQRSHVLRVTPPLEGEKEATPHVSEAHTYYPPEMDPKPIHIGARALLAGNVEKPVPDRCRYPNISESRSEFRSWFQNDVPDDADLDEDDAWDEWWENELEFWESEVRASLRDEFEWTDYVDADGNCETVTISVRYEDDE